MDATELRDARVVTVGTGPPTSATVRVPSSEQGRSVWAVPHELPAGMDRNETMDLGNSARRVCRGVPPRGDPGTKSAICLWHGIPTHSSRHSDSRRTWIPPRGQEQAHRSVARRYAPTSGRFQGKPGTPV